MKKQPPLQPARKHISQDPWPCAPAVAVRAILHLITAFTIVTAAVYRSGDRRTDTHRGDRQRVFSGDNPEHLFAQCSDYCELISQPEQMPRVLEIAMQTAIPNVVCRSLRYRRYRFARCVDPDQGCASLSQAHGASSDDEITLLADV